MTLRKLTNIILLVFTTTIVSVINTSNAALTNNNKSNEIPDSNRSAVLPHMLLSDDDDNSPTPLRLRIPSSILTRSKSLPSLDELPKKGISKTNSFPKSKADTAGVSEDVDQSPSNYNLGLKTPFPSEGKNKSGPYSKGRKK